MLSRNNSDTTSVLNYVEDVSQFKPKKKVKKLFAGNGRSRKLPRSPAKGKGKNGKERVRFTGYEDLDEDIEFERNQVEEHQTSVGQIQAEFLEVPDSENVQDAVVLTLLKACNPEASSLADTARENSRSNENMHKPHMAKVSSRQRGKDVYRHGLIRYGDYRPVIREVRASVPTNVLLSSETGCTIPAQFRDVTAYYPSDAEIANKDEKDLAYVEHKADTLLERASVYVVDDDMSGMNLAGVARLDVPDQFWESLFDDQAVDVNETISEGDREFIRDRGGELIDVSKIRQSAYATRNKDGSVRHMPNWAKSREFAGLRAEVSERYVEDPKPSPIADDKVESEDEGEAQMYVLNHDEVWCAWISTMRLVDTMQRRDYASDDSMDNAIRLFSFLRVLGVFVSTADDRASTIVSILRSLAASTEHVPLQDISSRIVSAHSGACNLESTSDSEGACSACVESEGLLMAYFVKAALLMSDRFEALLEKMCESGAIDIALARIDAERSSNAGRDRPGCAWTDFLRVAVASDDSSELMSAQMHLGQCVSARVGPDRFEALVEETVPQIESLTRSGRASEIVAAYNKAHVNSSDNTLQCMVCERAPKILWMASVCMSALILPCEGKT
jgi:hypothetical protein